jgi:DNA-binding response OmpR family regulator
MKNIRVVNLASNSNRPAQPLKRVLIVDDDRGFLEELREMLTLNGFLVSAIADSSAAVAAARAERPDVILLDLLMDEPNGMEVARQLRRSDETARIPIIAMTGHLDPAELPSLINSCWESCGFEDCLIKPFNPLEAVLRIRGYRDTSLRQGLPGNVAGTPATGHQADDRRRPR